MRDLVGLLLKGSPNRHMGQHASQPVLVRAGPGTGKTWMAKQAVFTLDWPQRGQGGSDGIRLVPIVVFVQRIIYLLRESSTTTSKWTRCSAATSSRCTRAKSTRRGATCSCRRTRCAR